jgi:uncharacterized DUF497 family protein
MNLEEVASAVQDAFATGRYEATRHFWHELRADGFLLADVHSALDTINALVEVGSDQSGNTKYEVAGLATDGRLMCVVCSFKETGVLLLITVYEGHGQ